MISSTCIAPVNIAVIKYWGKRDKKLILPFNDSISGTISTDQMCAKTTVAASQSFTKNRFWLNGIETPINAGERLQNCLRALKSLAEKKNVDSAVLKLKLHICSENNFPTAAGLASSAAGYACLVYTIAALYGIETDDELSTIARQGSGSACRSLYGGFVQWQMGTRPDGSDSVAVQLADEKFWPEMRVLILVVNDAKKAVSSTDGMQLTAQHSELFRHRVDSVVPARVAAMRAAIRDRDFTAFAELTMKDSNQFHAVCQDTYPPIRYMTDVSHKIVTVVHKYNEQRGSAKVAYTFDAGPNACLYLLEAEVSAFITLLNLVFPSERSHKASYVRGIPVPYMTYDREEVQELTKEQVYEKDLLKYIIHTKLGEGARKVTADQSLLNEHGLPRKLVAATEDVSTSSTAAASTAINVDLLIHMTE